MADTKMQEAAQVSQQSAGQTTPKQSNAAALEKFGGFLAVKGFIPAATDMNPAKKATRDIFLNEKKFQAKRKALADELRGWLEILDEEKNNASDYAGVCENQEEKYKKLLSDNITTALDTIKPIETTYRVLDSFFKNAGSDKLTNLRLINVNKEEFEKASSQLGNKVDALLRDSYDRLSLKDCYSLMVIPGYVMKDEDGKPSKPTLLKWAKIAHKYKVMLLTDHDKERFFDDLRENTAGYKDSDRVLSNVIMTGNWIVGRPKETLSELERDSDDKAFYIPPAAALAGKLYNESAVMSQGAAGKKYGTLDEVKGVEIDLLKAEIAALMDNQIVPMVYSEGRVMAFNNSTLFNGDNPALTEYPIVRVFDWVKKVLMNFVHDVALENWDPFKSPKQLEDNIKSFLNRYQGYGNLFQNYSIKPPVQDPVTKRISIDISLTPYYAAKNFTIKVSADKKDKSCEEV